MDTGLACAEPTKKYPDGRTGTYAGWFAHRTAKEPSCEPCRAANAARAKARYQSHGRGLPGPVPWQTPEGAREIRRLATARWRAANPERALEFSRRNDAARDPEKRRANQRSRWQRRRDLINALKDKPCTDCGVRYPPYVMHFDHRDPASKLFNIGQLSSRSLSRILAEIEKCDLVCANCHAERTWGPQGA